jgi:hypothetical protein
MSHIDYTDANAWLESTKLALTADNFDTALEDQISTQVLAQLVKGGYSTTVWVDSQSTPKLVKSIIAMLYVAAVYDRSYGDDVTDGSSNYAVVLRTLASSNIAGLLDGALSLAEEPSTNAAYGAPSFFPTDASSDDRIGFHRDPSDGGPAFLMGTVF